MKILEIVYGLASGGAERLVVDLCNEMSKTNEVYLLVLKDVHQYYSSQISNSVHVVYANFPVGFSLKLLFAIYRFIKQIQPDIVHYHSCARYMSLFSNLLLGKKIKFYMTFHSDIKKSYVKGISGLQVILAGCFGRTRFITISEENYQQFKDYYPRFKGRLIFNGRSLPVLTDRFSDVVKEVNSYKINSETIVFVHLARCHPIKNQKLLIGSFNKFLSEGANAVMLILGDNYESDLGRELIRLASNNIFFLGLKENVYDYLSCSDALCMSSLQEGMSMAFIEAVLTGIPILSTPVSGTAGVIKEKQNGLVSKSFAENDYYCLFKEFEEKRYYMKKMAQKMKYSSAHSISVCADKHIKWFKEG